MEKAMERNGMEKNEKGINMQFRGAEGAMPFDFFAGKNRKVDSKGWLL
nr:hypothetical protein [uncultured Anaerotignum sp.]